MKKYLLLLFLIGMSIETNAASKIGPEFRSGDFGPKCECEFGQGGNMEYTADGDCVPTDPPDCAEDGTCDDEDDCTGYFLDDGRCCQSNQSCTCTGEGICKICDSVDEYPECPINAKSEKNCICVPSGYDCNSGLEGIGPV